MVGWTPAHVKILTRNEKKRNTPDIPVVYEIPTRKSYSICRMYLVDRSENILENPTVRVGLC